MRSGLLPFVLAVGALAWCALHPAAAHDGPHASVHDTVAGVLQRLREDPRKSEVERLASGKHPEQVLTAEERDVLATGHLQFRTASPVRITVFQDRSLGSDPWWLNSGPWQPRTGSAKVGSTEFRLFQREFPAGEVGLGVNSLRGGGRHYFLVVEPVQPGDAVRLDEVYPGQVRLDRLYSGGTVWADATNTVAGFPTELTGAVLVQTLHARRDDGKLGARLRWTPHPAGPDPDHVVLTWSGDPSTTQTIQWRTGVGHTNGAVRFRRADSVAPWTVVPSAVHTLESVSTANNPVVTRHTVELAALQPSTRYEYQVGNTTAGGWTSTTEFTTGPATAESFSFVYMGDAQNGLEAWGKLVRGAYRARPDVAFYLMAGDLVDRGNERDDWDVFFANAAGVFNRRTLVPVVGNHECQGGRPTHYLGQFRLPANGPAGIERGRAYSLEYGAALIVVLDSNLPPENQTAWLDEQLGASRRPWKIVSYHHPAYSSLASRDNKKLRELWTPIFDKHRVDLALQGHDHAYLRTHPIREGQQVDNPADGTTYIVSVSGTKLYPQVSRPETVVGFTNVPTWQVLDLQVDPRKLSYRAYDRKGRLRDFFVISKPDAPPVAR